MQELEEVRPLGREFDGCQEHGDQYLTVIGGELTFRKSRLETNWVQKVGQCTIHEKRRMNTSCSVPCALIIVIFPLLSQAHEIPSLTVSGRIFAAPQ